MRAAYLSQDRWDISHAVKNLARKMVLPTEASLQDLKRLCRYLIRKPDVCQVFAKQARPNKLRIQVDSDHAGDAMTRRSTTGMVALYGLHVLKHSSNVQSTIALSTGNWSKELQCVWPSLRWRPRCLSNQMQLQQKVLRIEQAWERHATSRPDFCGCRRG